MFNKKQEVPIYHVSLVYFEIKNNTFATALRTMTTSQPSNEEEAINHAINYFKNDEDLQGMTLANKIVLKELFFVDKKSIHYKNSQKNINS